MIVQPVIQLTNMVTYNPNWSAVQTMFLVLAPTMMVRPLVQDGAALCCASVRVRACAAGIECSNTRLYVGAPVAQPAMAQGMKQGCACLLTPCAVGGRRGHTHGRAHTVVRSAAVGEQQAPLTPAQGREPCQF